MNSGRLSVLVVHTDPRVREALGAFTRLSLPDATVVVAAPPATAGTARPDIAIVELPEPPSAPALAAVTALTTAGSYVLALAPTATHRAAALEAGAAALLTHADPPETFTAALHTARDQHRETQQNPTRKDPS